MCVLTQTRGDESVCLFTIVTIATIVRPDGQKTARVDVRSYAKMFIGSQQEEAIRMLTKRSLCGASATKRAESGKQYINRDMRLHKEIDVRPINGQRINENYTSK